METTVITVSISKDLLEFIDTDRGDVPRLRYIKKYLVKGLESEGKMHKPRLVSL